MKKTVISICIAIIFGTSAALALPTGTAPAASVQAFVKKVPMSQDRLPKKVRKELKSASQEGWEFQKAYRLRFEGYMEMDLYEVHLRKETNDIILTFNAKGKQI